MNQIDTGLVKRLIGEQFPEWAHLEVKPVKFSGHDNRTFHLGMSVRLPSDAAMSWTFLMKVVERYVKEYYK